MTSYLSPLELTHIWSGGRQAQTARRMWMLTSTQTQLLLQFRQKCFVSTTNLEILSKTRFHVAHIWSNLRVWRNLTKIPFLIYFSYPPVFISSRNTGNFLPHEDSLYLFLYRQNKRWTMQHGKKHKTMEKSKRKQHQRACRDPNFSHL